MECGGKAGLSLELITRRWYQTVEDANERPTNSSTLQRQAFPQPAWTHAQAPLRVEYGEAGRGQRLMPTPIDMLVLPLFAPANGACLPGEGIFLSSLHEMTQVF